jgi:outer membrane protein OmpA-like peptidoglycan-associated protein
MGVYFSDKDFLFEKTPYPRISPSVYLRDAALRPVTRDTNWQKIEIEYKATGIETFITLGNFSKRDVTGSTGIDMENNFFVLFDDVSLTPADPNERLCPDWKMRKKDIYDQDERHEFLDRSIKIYRTKPPSVSKPTSTLTVKVDTLIIPDLLFATNSFVLSKKAITTLEKLTEKMRTTKMDSIIVSGHTDWTGDPVYNKQLSWRRASSVAAFLQNYFPTRIISDGYGSDRPVGDNRTPSGREKNRRVEVFFYIRQ